MPLVRSPCGAKSSSGTGIPVSQLLASWLDLRSYRPCRDADAEDPSADLAGCSQPSGDPRRL